MLAYNSVWGNILKYYSIFAQSTSQYLKHFYFYVKIWGYEDLGTLVS